MTFFDKDEWFCVGFGIFALIVIFVNLNKYRGKNVNLLLLFFIYLNIALQVSAFMVLPMDIIRVRTF